MECYRTFTGVLHNQGVASLQRGVGFRAKLRGSPNTNMAAVSVF